MAERKTEPNSGLGKAITYVLRHWRPLTLFLREKGAPIDNNICRESFEASRSAPKERDVLPDAERRMGRRSVHEPDPHLRTEWTSIRFDYLIELQRHHAELDRRPSDWMPWNYRETLARIIPAAA